ncbi:MULTISPECIES: type II toxin-antitoxin system RelE/ParE family toxin [Methylobacterium]|uniref:Addiction module antitoxin RelB n=1 Tax=Methylobacterium thuringiense TaxID=1003091 RepID=A0ABQ4TPN7_9HYPH|nr:MULTISPECIES: type II toxin-antitoxin system RelE/ParE family toxin [Methylobacterium]TXN19636.1 type II toxin-antitoxin system RelE/ParE family toxin [Methylobacterium sp. WL9]GJE56601.1 hypothetical protein EKPJFOCH_3109 [Methylobacterium thuringiense]
MLKQTDQFRAWIRGLRDRAAVGVINGRLKRLDMGNPGYAAPVGDGVSELKIDVGPGYRVYYKVFADGTTVLIGGDKADQPRNIKAAKALADIIGQELKRQAKDVDRSD